MLRFFLTGYLEKSRFRRLASLASYEGEVTLARNLPRERAELFVPVPILILVSLLLTCTDQDLNRASDRLCKTLVLGYPRLLNFHNISQMVSLPIVPKKHLHHSLPQSRYTNLCHTSHTVTQPDRRYTNLCHTYHIAPLLKSRYSQAVLYPCTLRHTHPVSTVVLSFT